MQQSRLEIGNAFFSEISFKEEELVTKPWYVFSPLYIDWKYLNFPKLISED
ncbi:hypothetical protein ACT4XT_15915 [Acinetobacter baumannii]|mgnify:CR=1 FL=1|uniref:hypothetical protein n=1 Tax=Acinetobacter baumannii TaxID=470 RepID=UPI000445131D|nr:hypothetical protein [Acinetobacter baumannii]EXE66240.1 hypothetical protein J583_4210 [Acinetobacter baumannii 83444]MDV4307703.1 hypothetical protein [Acinetobacter baumannii]